MSQEVFQLVMGMYGSSIAARSAMQASLQITMQCAPVMAGLKASNLLIIKQENLGEVKQILNKTRLSCYVLLETEQNTMVLLYDQTKLESYLSDKKVKALLTKMGYEGTSLAEILPVFRIRYRNYMTEQAMFPHEMGVLLAYPIEDVEGFIRNKGKNFLYAGYWKVYTDLPVKMHLFDRFELAREALIRLISSGVSIAEAMELYRESTLQRAAV